jgi:nucleotide-binding universal stress UspA family protein
MTLGRRQGFVLHPTELSSEEEAAFAHALKLALATGIDLRILHVDRNPHDFEWADFPHVRGTLTRWGVALEHGPVRAGREGGIRVKKALVHGADPLERILRYIENRPPDIIVLAAHRRRGLDRLTHPSVAEPLARRSGAATLFVPRDGRGFVSADDGSVRLETVLVPVAARPDPSDAIEATAALLRTLGVGDARIVALHVGTDFPTVENRTGLAIERLTRDGEVVDEIAAAARELGADLVAMSTEGHVSFLDALRGDTTERILREVECPVLAVPAGAPRERGPFVW